MNLNSIQRYIFHVCKTLQTQGMPISIPENDYIFLSCHFLCLSIYKIVTNLEIMSKHYLINFVIYKIVFIRASTTFRQPFIQHETTKIILK